MPWFVVVAIAVASFVLGAWSWPYVHQWALGASEYAARLRDKARAIETNLRAKL